MFKDREGVEFLGKGETYFYGGVAPGQFGIPAVKLTGLACVVSEKRG